MPTTTLEDSKMRVRSVVAAIIAMGTIGGSGVWYVATVVNDIKRDISEMRSNSYTLDRASEVALRQAIENPGLRIPNPRDPTQVIVVTAGRVSTTPSNGP